MTAQDLATLVREVHAATVPNGMETRIVGIDGCGGAGKSTLASLLSQRLKAPVIHTDDFASWDIPINWHDRLMDQVLLPLSKNQPSRYQRFDWVKNELAEWHDVTVGGPLILEGVTAIRALFRPMLSFKIFVETPKPIRLARGLARDGNQALPLWISWQAAEDQYLARENPAEFADRVFDGTIPFA